MAASKVFVILLFIIAFAILLFGLSRIDPNKTKLGQATNPMTHLPAWHPPAEGN